MNSEMPKYNTKDLPHLCPHYATVDLNVRKTPDEEEQRAMNHSNTIVIVRVVTPFALLYQRNEMGRLFGDCDSSSCALATTFDV